MDAFISAFKPRNPTAKVQSKNLHIPWVEKYRPKTIEEVSHQSEVVSVLRKCVENGDLPNLLFYGPPGTGKTSLILALARQMFGSLFSERLLELNASDERGIVVIREKVKVFAQSAVSSTDNIPPFKLVVLDEADSMTAPAQAALRRIMETEVRTTRFCLTCNYVTRIIDPITSRCAKFRFHPLINDVAQSRIRYIADKEKLIISDDTIDYLLKLSHGDLRQGITMLQCVSQLKIESEGILLNDLEEAASVVPERLIKNLLKTIESGSFDKMRVAIKNLLCEGYSANQTIHQLHQYILDTENLTDLQKAPILEALAISDSRLIESADEYLQLMSVGGTFLKCMTL